MNNKLVDVIFIKEGEREFLTEQNRIEKSEYVAEYVPCHAYESVFDLYMYLNILDIRSKVYLRDGLYTEQFYARGVFLNKDDNISFFGSEEKIKEVQLVLFPVEGQNESRFAFTAFSGVGTEDVEDVEDVEDSDDSLTINVMIPFRQFEKIKQSIVEELCQTIRCRFNLKNIGGLYVENSFAPWYNYKILHDVEVVKNKDLLPKSFTALKYPFSGDIGNFEIIICHKEFKLLPLDEEEWESKADLELSDSDKILRQITLTLNRIFFILVMILVALMGLNISEV